jgi:hypothetical protein
LGRSITLCLSQNKNDQGFPSNENRSSGSKLVLFPPIVRLRIVAGLPNENEGILENPLLVTLIIPLNVKGVRVVSVF